MTLRCISDEICVQDMFTFYVEFKVGWKHVTSFKVRVAYLSFVHCLD